LSASLRTASRYASGSMPQESHHVRIAFERFARQAFTRCVAKARSNSARPITGSPSRRPRNPRYAVRHAQPLQRLLRVRDCCTCHAQLELDIDKVVLALARRNLRRAIADCEHDVAPPGRTSVLRPECRQRRVKSQLPFASTLARQLHIGHRQVAGVDALPV
jgi:hypothetical protein